MRLAGGALKIRFIEIHHARGWIGNGNGSGLKNFVIERDGQFCFAQTCVDEQSKFAGNGTRLRDGFASDGIHDGICGQLNVFDNEPTMKLEIFELPEVNHVGIQPPFAPSSTPK